MCGPCSRAHFGCVPTACVSSPRDWAVSIGSHMQQNMDISFGASTPRRTASCVSQRSRLKTTTQKLAIVSPETQLSFVSVTTRVFRPAGRLLHVTKIRKCLFVHAIAVLHVIVPPSKPLLTHAYSVMTSSAGGKTNGTKTLIPVLQSAPLLEGCARPLA